MDKINITILILLYIVVSVTTIMDRINSLKYKKSVKWYHYLGVWVKFDYCNLTHFGKVISIIPRLVSILIYIFTFILLAPLQIIFWKLKRVVTVIGIIISVYFGLIKYLAYKDATIDVIPCYKWSKK